MPGADFLSLSAGDRLEALGVAAAASGRPAYLLEKDVWVVWALDVLFAAPFGEKLVFKGGTSLSKVFKLIRRFSEDLDLTYDIRALVPTAPQAGGEVRPGSGKEAQRISDEAKGALIAWLEKDVTPVLQLALDEQQLEATLRRNEESLYLEYRGSGDAPAYVRPWIQLEFGGRSTGEPCEPHEVACDAAPHVADVVFPTANPRVMSAERTFWEKATAVHSFCVRGRANAARYARHWHDIVRLDDAGIAANAISNRPLAEQVANYKALFYRIGGVDYIDAVSGGMVLVPSGAFRASLKDDWRDMVDAGLMLDDDVLSFDELIDRCSELQSRING